MAKLYKVYPRGIDQNPVLYTSTGSERYDCQRSIVVKARNPRAARKIAADNKGDEGREVWMDPKITICKELKHEGPEAVICRDYNSA